MNLLEHYILEVFNVEDISNEFERILGYPPKEPFLQVNMMIDCYGIKECVQKTFFKSKWEKAQKQGYYMA